MRTVRWVGVALLAVSGCKCGTDLSQVPFACAQDSECADGYRCVAGQCSTSTGGADGGGAPAVDGGARDAGVSDGGAPRDAGSADGGVGLDAGTGSDAGVASGPPFTLAFASMSQSVVAGSCSAPLIVQIQDDAGLPARVTSPIVLSVTDGGVGNFTLYAGAGCATAWSGSTTVQPGSNTATLSFLGTSAGMETVTATASGLGSVLQQETISGAAANQLAFNTASKSIPLDGCTVSPSTVQVEDSYGNPVTVATPLVVSLSSTNAPGVVGFFSDSACVNAITTVTVPANGSVSGSFYLKGINTGSPAATASSSLPVGAKQVETVNPEVRTQNCVAPSSGASFTCNIQVALRDITKAFLVFGTDVGAQTPGHGNFACDLSAIGTITCYRSNGVTPPATSLQWQIVERVDGGMNVQHIDNAACTPADGGFDVAISPVASMADTFLLKSSADVGSTYEEAPNLFEVALTTTSNVHVAASVAACPTNFALQVVELPGVNVTRGNTGPMPGTSLTVVPTGTFTPATTALLFSYRATPVLSAVSVCDRMVEGTVTSTGITFTRGCAGPATIDDISWELIDFQGLGQVQAFPFSLPAGEAGSLVNITPVDPTRTLALTPGQPVSGQEAGAATTDAGTWVGDELLAMRLVDGGTQVNFTRYPGQAIYGHGQVIELAPYP